jgi:transposase
MFWGAIKQGMRSQLWPMLGDPDSARGGVTARVVLECLQENLPTMLEPGNIFAQDNASTHTARIVQNWLRGWAQENGISLVDWPAYSPDLNPIENVWKLLKAEIYKRRPDLADLPKTDQSLQELITTAIMVWEDLGEAIINKVIQSMPRRLQAVIDARGWYTKY